MKRFLTGIMNDPRWSESAAEITLPTQTADAPMSPDFQSDADVARSSSSYLQSVFPGAESVDFETLRTVINVQGLAFQNAKLLYTEAYYLQEAAQELNRQGYLAAANNWKNYLDVKDRRNYCKNMVVLIIDTLFPGEDGSRSEYHRQNKLLLGDSVVFKKIGTPELSTPSSAVMEQLETNYQQQVQTGAISAYRQQDSTAINSPVHRND